MNVAVTPASSAATVGQRIRVMIVDDAVLVRGLFARWIEAEPDLQVVASLRTGREAVNQLERIDPDVVLLDIEMPELDGITALPILLEKKRNLVVIMASTLTRRNAEISLKALSLGAADYIPKPASNSEVTAAASFRRDLIEKIRQLGLRAKRTPSVSDMRPRVAAPPIAPSATPVRPVILPGKIQASLPGAMPAAPIVLRPFPATAPRVLLVGSSTGGPQALNSLVTKISSVLDRAPVLITQHMPPMFTTILAEHLARASGRTAREAVDGEEVNAGTIYLAPGGKHMKVARRDGIAVVEIDDGPLVNFCKPAVDPLFSTAATVWGQWVLGLVLTGMGSDGLRGAQAIVSAGGNIIGQDEASSVVWGMPGQVAHAGLCSAVLPVDEIGPRVARMFTGERA